jgi:reactive intermediate/imine deaminase
MIVSMRNGPFRPARTPRSAQLYDNCCLRRGTNPQLAYSCGDLGPRARFAGKASVARVETMAMDHYTAPSVSTPPGYSHAVGAVGLIFVSGQVAFDSDGSVVGIGDMAEQTRQAFRNLGAVLERAGASYADIVKLTYFVRDVGAVAEIRAARNEFIDTTSPPASTLVEVSALVRPELLVEIEAVAVAPQAAGDAITRDHEDDAVSG